MPMLSDLYREVGVALHKAQLVEYNVVSIYIILARTGPLASIKETEESYWSRKMLGQLLKPLLDPGRLPEDANLFMQTFLKARNHLAHSFFVSSSEAHTSKGIESLLREVAAMQDVFDRALQFFDHLLSELACASGIDTEIIKAQARTAVLSMEGETA